MPGWWLSEHAKRRGKRAAVNRAEPESATGARQTGEQVPSVFCVGAALDV